MLITSFETTITVSTHSVDEFEYEAIAHLDADISPALPYLNATLSRGIYLPVKPALSWRHEGRNIGFWPQRIAVDHLESREQVAEVIQQLVDLVNRVWDQRAEIEPDHTTHERLQPLEVYRLLPQTNCRACGESTCFNLALKLVAAQAELTSCQPLYEDPAQADQRAALEMMLASKWPAL
ncbi:MAG: hypothetical protein KKA73_07370 [Chloroflexi bacterium]|nr:hypothetical protein [Chloroflexota bacterium]MBU1747491.1 hypothetical protein [Chloroflexota bacterium]MBU1879404.1 hypothetical protein [Chloroflexota bacterium]